MFNTLKKGFCFSSYKSSLIFGLYIKVTTQYELNFILHTKEGNIKSARFFGRSITHLHYFVQNGVIKYFFSKEASTCDYDYDEGI